jgi:hypothetical protein
VNSIAVKAGFSVHISSSRRHGTMSNVLGGMKKATPSATKKNGALTAVYTQNGEDIMKPSGLYHFRSDARRGDQEWNESVLHDVMKIAPSLPDLNPRHHAA